MRKKKHLQPRNCASTRWFFQRKNMCVQEDNTGRAEDVHHEGLKTEHVLTHKICAFAAVRRRKVWMLWSKNPLIIVPVLIPRERSRRAEVLLLRIQRKNRSKSSRIAIGLKSAPTSYVPSKETVSPPQSTSAFIGIGCKRHYGPVSRLCQNKHTSASKCVSCQQANCREPRRIFQ